MFRFSSDLTMISHLRMEGKYFVEPSTKEVEKHTHVVFDLQMEHRLDITMLESLAGCSWLKQEWKYKLLV